MRRSLQGKLILSYLAVALLTVLVVSALIRLTSNSSLANLVVEEQIASLTQSVQDYYNANGTLDGFFDSYLVEDRKDFPPPQQSQPGDPGKSHGVRGVRGLVDASYRALIPTLGYAIGENVPEAAIQQKTAVQVNGQTVAWILPDTVRQFSFSPEEELFLQRTTLAIGLAAGAGVLVAVLMGYLLASRLLKPIRQLTQASQSLARGDLNQQVPVTSRDELGQLTATFNQMSADLGRADQQRKRITADITHDLSTPIQIISGYIEMLEDGEVTLSPQRLEIIKTELGNLRRLVGDLTILTAVEAGGQDLQLEPVQPGMLLERVYHTFQPIAERQGVDLALDVPTPAPDILVDEGRMEQVLKNLLENALRYTPRGGRIQLSLQVGEQVELRVTDNGQGIDPEDLPYVFERFYRADKSRGGSSGKMGLGLAICKALVAAQGGTIAAESKGQGLGTSIVIRIAPASGV